MTKYIGSQPATSFEAVKKDRFTGLTGTGVTLSHSVSSVQDVVVWVNSVKQDYNNYSVSGTALTLGGSLVSSDVVQVLYVGRTFQTVNPSAASVGNNEVASTIITGQTALAATPDDTDELLISDAGTLKRIDYSYLKASNAPAFQAYNSSDQSSIGDNTYTKLILNTELYDTDSAYDNSSNYRFTPQTAGKYYCYGQVTITAHSGNDDAKELGLKFYKNGSAATNLLRQSLYNLGYQNTPSLTLSAVIDFNGSSDYIELYAKINTVGNGANSTAVANESRFGAYKLIGV
jgi:hypothetical protein